jgi:hypothetical protein
LNDQPVARHRATQAENKRIHQLSMPWVGFEPTLPASERAERVNALHRADTVTGFDRNTTIPSIRVLELSCLKLYRVLSEQADWTLTHTSHKDTEQNTIEASITLDGVILTGSLIRWSPNERLSVCREVPVSAIRCSRRLMSLQNEHLICIHWNTHHFLWHWMRTHEILYGQNQYINISLKKWWQILANMEPVSGGSIMHG